MALARVSPGQRNSVARNTLAVASGNGSYQHCFRVTAGDTSHP